MHFWRGPAFAACALLLAGCASVSPEPKLVEAKAPVSQSTAAASPKDETAEWQAVKTRGLSLKVPKDWQPFDLTSDQLNAVLDEAVRANEGFKASAEQMKAAAASGAVRLFVLGPMLADQAFRENLNVVVQPAPGAMTPSQLAEAYKGDMSALVIAGTEIRTSEIELPSGKFAKLQSVLSMTTATGPQRISSQAYMIVHKNEVHTFTFSTLEAKATEFEKTADAIMKTLKFE